MKVPAGYEQLDLYAILHCDAAVSGNGLKKAYRRAALRTHPDKQGGSDDAFGKVAFAYAVLNDQEQRRHYDETGSVVSVEQSLEDLVRTAYCEVTGELIEQDREEYRAAQEKLDLIEGYTNGNGSFDHVLGYVLHVEADEQDRLIKMLKDLIASGTIKELPLFTKTTTPQACKKRLNRYKREAKLYANGHANDNLSDNKASDMASLAESIRGRSASAESEFIAEMEAKYGVKKRTKLVPKAAKIGKRPTKETKRAHR